MKSLQTLENTSICVWLPHRAVKLWSIVSFMFVSLSFTPVVGVFAFCILICLFLLLFFRCSGGVEVMQVPRSSQWRSQLIKSGFGCWTPPPLHPPPSPPLIPSLAPSISDGSMGRHQPQPSLLGVFTVGGNSSCSGNNQPPEWQARGPPGLAPVG